MTYASEPMIKLDEPPPLLPPPPFESPSIKIPPAVSRPFPSRHVRV
uniref:Uncharacterized protein n=1 Tax=Lepeophtheirus salmonis TaxID=72036 RepID=A0A0K2UDR0_LEPSM